MVSASGFFSGSVSAAIAAPAWLAGGHFAAHLGQGFASPVEEMRGKRRVEPTVMRKPEQARADQAAV